mmetsp:Transcript_3642/g.9787  ORF Transcript_3642/g.9787 Transcript_3642/m.9787 type:complete len:129 (-) Transcript_3642:43-429(-)
MRDTGGPRGQEEEEEEDSESDAGRSAAEQSAEEIQLEAEIRSIELDMAVMDLRRDLGLQERLVEDWSLALRTTREETLAHEWTEEDRREDKECRKGMKGAQDEVERLRERLDLLERGRPARDDAREGR